MRHIANGNVALDGDADPPALLFTTTATFNVDVGVGNRDGVRLRG